MAEPFVWQVIALLSQSMIQWLLTSIVGKEVIRLLFHTLAIVGVPLECWDCHNACLKQRYNEERDGLVIFLSVRGYDGAMASPLVSRLFDMHAPIVVI